MLFGTQARALFAAASISLAAHAGDSVEIPRTVDGTLGSGATQAAVVAMLVGATWRYRNPDKEHSTWESKTLTFDATGSVDITTWYAFGPRTVKALWHVVRAGNAPLVDIDGVGYAMAPCRSSQRTTCLVGLRP